MILIPRADRFREREKVLYPSAALLLMTASFILTKTGRDALYFQKDGLFDLPWAYLGIATLAVPVAMMTLSLTKRFGLRPIRIVLPLTVALVQAVFYVVAEPGGGVVMTLFFMSIPLIYGVMFSTTWLFGGELVETLPKERLSVVYGRLGAASMVGGLLGAGVAKLLAARLTASAFILIGAVGLLLAVAVILLGHAKFPFRVAGSEGEDLPAEPSEMMPAFSEIFNTLRFDYVRTLVLVAGAAAVVGVLIEFQFYVLASLTTTGARASTDFFANFYIVVTLVALLLQLFAMPILQRKIGIRGSLLVLPLSLLSGALLLAVNASGIGRAALRVAEGGLKSSIHRANWEQAFLPIGQPRRLVVKVLVDGLSSRVAEGLAAGLLLVWLHGFVQQRSLNLLEMSWISYLIAGSCFAWIVLVSRLARDLSPDCCPELRRGELTSDLPLPDSCCVTKALLKRQSVSSIAF